MDQRRQRPDMDQYMMRIALTVRTRANCTGNRVGAVLARERHIVATGYNGTPHNMPNCDEGGCERCANRARYTPGTGYDVCICVHAEQNALLSAARFGIGVEHAVLYTTLRPCFGCTKEMLQAGISGVRFLHTWQHPDPELQSEYEKLQARFPAGVKHVDVEDPDAAWAVSRNRLPPAEPGHTVPGA